MKRTILTAGLLGYLVVASVHAATADIDQQITLHPGWNAIYLQVDPSQESIEEIFATIPVASVWRWIPQSRGQQFIQDPDEGLLSVDGWYGYYPEPRPEAMLTNLYGMQGNTPYLVKLDDTVSHQLTISGQPRLRRKIWVSNSYNLVGFPVDPAQPPSFSEYLTPSKAHAGQSVYHLNSAGQWMEIADLDAHTIDPNQAYWVYTDGPSNYQGPLTVTLDGDKTMDYSAALTETSLIISNLSELPTTITLHRELGATLPMTFKLVDDETGEVAWPTLPATLSFDLEPGEDLFLDLAVTRAAMTEERMEQVFSITDGLGSKLLLLAGADTYQPLTLPTAKAWRGSQLKAVPTPHAGLWAGQVDIDAVSLAQQGGTVPMPVGKAFPLRIIMHVDATGQARLLKQIIQMWQEGTAIPSESDPDLLVVDTPGHYVLLTDPDLIPNYNGVTVRNNQSAGIRLSAIGYDFPALHMEMTGEFAQLGMLAVELALEPSHPTNPFFHRYHPDHDNLDPQFLNYSAEAFQVVRAMTFEFSAHNPRFPDLADPPGWGSSEMGGFFRETITGLHKNTLFVEGSFTLRRVAATPVLNQ